MAVSLAQPAGAAKLRSAASAGLRLAGQKFMSILPDFDPMVQISASFLAIKLATGFSLDRDTISAAGMLVMLLFEELI